MDELGRYMEGLFPDLAGMRASELHRDYRWPCDKFGLEQQDLFHDLHDRFNTFKMALQTPEAWHHDVADCATRASSKEEFYRFIEKRKKERVLEIDNVLMNIKMRLVLGKSSGIQSDILEATAQWSVQQSMDTLVNLVFNYLTEEGKQEVLREVGHLFEKYRTHPKPPRGPPEHGEGEEEEDEEEQEQRRRRRRRQNLAAAGTVRDNDPASFPRNVRGSSPFTPAIVQPITSPGRPPPSSSSSKHAPFAPWLDTSDTTTDNSPKAHTSSHPQQEPRNNKATSSQTPRLSNPCDRPARVQKATGRASKPRKDPIARDQVLQASSSTSSLPAETAARGGRYYNLRARGAKQETKPTQEATPAPRSSEREDNGKAPRKKSKRSS